MDRYNTLSIMSRALNTNIIKTLWDTYGLDYNKKEDRNKIVKKIIIQIENDKLNKRWELKNLIESLGRDIFERIYEIDNLKVFKFIRNLIPELNDLELLAHAIFYNATKIIRFMCQAIVQPSLTETFFLITEKLEKERTEKLENNFKLSMNNVSEGLQTIINCYFKRIEDSYLYGFEIFHWMYAINLYIIPYFDDKQRKEFFEFVKPFVTDKRFFTYIENEPENSDVRKSYEKDKIFQRPSTGTFMSMIVSRELGKTGKEPVNEVRKKLGIKGGKGKSLKRRKTLKRRKSVKHRK